MLRYLPLLLLLPVAAFAQTAEVVQKLEAKLEAERAAQRAEDVEVLRRLLNKAVGLPDKVSVSVSEQSVQRTGGAEDFLRRGNAPVTIQVARASAAVGPFDGVYLPGAGVVFTLHVPGGAGVVTDGSRIGLSQTCNSCHAGITAQDRHHASVAASQCSTCHDNAVSPPASLSDWDRTRLDVRGEKPKSADPTPKKERAALCQPGGLHTQVAGVLAANAKNVRHLPEKEAITVVVTFDEVKPTGRVWKGTTYYEPVEKIEDGKPTTKYELRTKEEWVDPDATPAQTPADGKAFTPSEVKALTLADLHLKQGKYKDACDAYGEALGRFWAKPFKVTPPSTLTPAQRQQYADELQKGVRDAMKNYAKALLLADQPDRAKEALDMATGFVVLEVTPTTVPAKATGPAKLILTASKVDIDASKDAAAVKKVVKVERVNFPDAKK